MRPRALAIIILSIFLLIPIILYWYFYDQKVTSLIFQSESILPYTVSLRGSLEYEYFPLLDEVFSYESICTGACIFSPIPPLKYTIVLSGSGKETLTDTIKLTSGESFKYKFALTSTFDINKVATFPPEMNVREKGYLGVDQEGGPVFLKTDATNQQIGIYLSGRSSPFTTISLPITHGKLEASRSYAILQGSSADQYIFSLMDRRESMIFPYSDDIEIVTHSGSWKVRTQTALYEYIGDNWVKNPRFTDFIDISPRYRIGYIDASDSAKLSLQNLPSDNSLFILLDRMSTEISIIKKGYKIRGFLYHKGFPSIIDEAGNISNISLALDK